MRSRDQLVQETLLAQLSEYQQQQQQQLDELNPFTGAAKAAGAVSGAIKGAGQKVAGTAKRASSAMGSAFKQGQTGAQKAVAGQDYKDTPSAAKPAKARGSGIARGVGDTLRTLGRGIGAVGDIKGKIDSYDYAAGTGAQQRAKSTGVNSVAQHWDAARDAKDAAKAADTTQAAQPAAGAAQPTAGAAQPTASAAPKVTATGGGVAPIATTSAAPKTTTVPGQKPAATGAATKATTVPGQKPAKTAQDIAAKTGAATSTKKPDLKIAGQKVKPTDPLYDKLVAMIPAETRSSIDGLSDYDKGRLKKELSA